MRIKKLLPALLLIIMFLCLPIIQAVSYNEVNNKHRNINAISSFKVKLTEEQVRSFNDFINKLPSVDDQNIARTIANQILSDEQDINVEKFGEILNKYGFENVLNYQKTADIVDDLLNFLMNLLTERLGWVYDFLQKTSNALSSAQRLWQDKSLPKEIITEIELLIENLNELQNLTTLLIEGKYIHFLREWSVGIIIEDITEIIQSIETIASDLGIFVGDLSRFIVNMSTFMNWLSDNPWEQPIHVYGRVIESTKGLSNVTIRCRGITSITDEDGNFSFFVNSTPDEYSIPPNQYYGIHLCIVTAEYNETIKETPMEFSYVFSDGGIYWLFLMNDNDSANKEHTQSIISLQIRVWTWIHSKNFISKFHQYFDERRWTKLLS